MSHRTAPDFWELYNGLAPEIRALADRAFETLKSDPHHPSLRLKKVGRYWSARVGRNYRALAVEDAHGFVWFWIGPHGGYERQIG